MTHYHRRNEQAIRLFNGIAGNYKVPAQIYSLLQYDRWHKFLESCLTLTPETRVLDVSTGTGLVAMRIAKAGDCQVVGLDLNRKMLGEARKNFQKEGLDSTISLVEGRAENLPFTDNSFDVVVFTFLLRYVDYPQATVSELGRVLKPGGQMISLEFYMPKGPVLYPLWLLHTRLVMPITTKLMSPGWREVGSFLGPSISRFYQRYSLHDVESMWQKAGFNAIQSTTLSLGGAVVTRGQKGENVET